MKPTPHTARGFDNVYDPAEDSFFLLDCLEKDEHYLRSLRGCPLVAEIGSGSGIVSSFVPNVLPQPHIGLGADVSPAAAACTKATYIQNWPKSLDFDVVRGNLLSWIRPNTVDVLLFNPPYVPSETTPGLPAGAEDTDDRWVDLALDGGADGMEITNIVLDHLERYLSTSGVAYILFCASNHPDAVTAKMAEKGWEATHIDTRRAGIETLTVYRYAKALR